MDCWVGLVALPVCIMCVVYGKRGQNKPPGELYMGLLRHKVYQCNDVCYDVVCRRLLACDLPPPKKNAPEKRSRHTAYSRLSLGVNPDGKLRQPKLSFSAVSGTAILKLQAV